MYEMMITYTNNLTQYVKYYQRERERERKEEAKGENPNKGREPEHGKSRALNERASNSYSLLLSFP